MRNKKNIPLIIFSFLCGYAFPSLSSLDEFFADPVAAFYMGYDASKKVFLFDVDQYGKEEIPFADLGIAGNNAELYDTILQLNKYELMATQYVKNKKWDLYLAKHGGIQKLNSILLDLIGDQTIWEDP